MMRLSVSYLVHAVALFNWLIRIGKASHNPLKGVFKLPRAETFRRRALSFEEFVRFMRAFWDKMSKTGKTCPADGRKIAR